MLATVGPAAYVSLVTAALVVIGHLLAARDRRRKAGETTGKLTEIAVNVDGRLDSALAELADLRAALVDARLAPAETPPFTT